MSVLTKLCGKLTQEVELSDGTKIVLKAPKVKDLAEIMPLFSEENQKENNPKQLIKTTDILSKMLKESIPDATDEEIEEVVLTELNVLLKGLTELLSKAFKSDKPKN